MSSIFLSCGNDYRPFGNDLVMALMQEGISVWSGFNHELEAREDFWQTIDTALKKCRVVLAVLADDDHAHVLDECARASSSTDIVFVHATTRFDHTALPDNLADRATHVDLSDRYSTAGAQNFDRLVEVLREILSPREYLANPSKNRDFFDQLRSLKEALDSLSSEISAINDPERLTSSVRATRAYLDAFSAFLDERDNVAPDDIPAEVPATLSKLLRSANWTSFSTQSRGWIETILKFLEKLL